MGQDESHAARADSFGTVAQDYDRLRAQPPSEVLDWLVPESAVAALELGAGTGLLTALLAARVARVTALEPDARMRAVLATKGLGVRSLAGRAEEIPLPDDSVDLVVAQSAWHWVDEARAIPEVARVLHPGGRFALVWTGTDRSVDWLRTVWSGGSTHTSSGWSPRVEVERERSRYAVDLAAGGVGDRFGAPETALFGWKESMTKEDLVALAGTYSAVIALDDATRRDHLARMARALDSVEAFAGVEVIDVPMRSYCWRTVRL